MEVCNGASADCFLFDRLTSSEHSADVYGTRFITCLPGLSTRGLLLLYLASALQTVDILLPERDLIVVYIVVHGRLVRRAHAVVLDVAIRLSRQLGLM